MTGTDTGFHDKTNGAFFRSYAEWSCAAFSSAFLPRCYASRASHRRC
jgi:hypothetical protein